jgi:hypothetical protein
VTSHQFRSRLSPQGCRVYCSRVPLSRGGAGSGTLLLSLCDENIERIFGETAARRSFCSGNRLTVSAILIAANLSELPGRQGRGCEIDRHRLDSSLCPYRPAIFSLAYSLTFRRTAGGRFGDAIIRLMITGLGPALLSRLSNAQAVLRQSPRAVACLAAVS